MKPYKPSFLRLYGNVFIMPRRSFQNILANNSRLRYGFFAFLIPAIGYTAFYIMAWYAGGAPSTFKPWLAIPMEEYFKYDIFLTLPGYFLSWIAAAAVVHLLAKSFKGSGSFDDTLVVLGFGIGVASWSTMLHDLSDAVLSVTGVISMKEYEQLLNEPTFWRYLLLSLYVIYFFWFTILFSKGIKEAQGISTAKSILLSLTGLVVFQTVLLIFIR